MSRPDATSATPEPDAQSVTSPGQLRARLEALSPADANYATAFVDSLLSGGRAIGASDLHLHPGPDALAVRWRIDGVLQPGGRYPRELAPNIVARLKVLAELLTYRTDSPQEGRIRTAAEGVEMRVSTFPTLHGEQAVVRLFGSQQRLERLSELGLPDAVREQLAALLHETSGAVLISGPAGSGKTTTAYAALREIAAASGGGRSIATLEDPVEVALANVSQSQVNMNAGFDLTSGLRFLLRQDPEVILVGEMRDRPTAEVALQAALTGHLVLTTFHAGSAAGALSRLLDMGLEPYSLRSGILAVISQRLVRRLCDCAVAADPIDAEARLGLPVTSARLPKGCPQCAGSGYRGRLVLAEMCALDGAELGQAILDRRDARALEQLATQHGLTTCWQRACEAVEAGWTSPAEVRRVLGFAHQAGSPSGQ